MAECFSLNICILGLKGHHMNRSNEWCNKLPFQCQKRMQQDLVFFSSSACPDPFRRTLCSRQDLSLEEHGVSCAAGISVLSMRKPYSTTRTISPFSWRFIPVYLLVDVIPALFPLAHFVHVFQESLSERLQEKYKMDLPDRIKHLSLNVLAWLLSLGLAVGCSAGIYFLGTDPELVNLVWHYHKNTFFPCILHPCAYVLLQAFSFNHSPNDLTAEASTLLLPVVVSIINLIVPILYSLISKIESYSNPRAKIYISIVRCDHCFLTITRSIRFPLLTMPFVLFLEMLFWRCPFLESFAFTGWILFPKVSQ